MAEKLFVFDTEMTQVADAIRAKRKTTDYLAFPGGFVSAIEEISGGLNFEIVGGTEQPINPEENTIWVNTDQAIEEWTFSIDQPSSAKTGDLWISTQNSSAIAFDALEENNLMIYPLDAYQYLNNTWTKKPMAIYKNGNWETGDLVLYDGVEWNSDYPYTVSGVTVTQNNGRLQLTGGKSTITFKTVLDLTGYNTIEIDFDGDDYYSSCTHNVIANSTVVVSQVHHYQDTDGDRRIQFSIPIADLTGLHTFEISMWSSGGYTGYLHSLILKKS